MWSAEIGCRGYDILDRSSGSNFHGRRRYLTCVTAVFSAMLPSLLNCGLSKVGADSWVGKFRNRVTAVGILECTEGAERFPRMDGL